MKKLFTRLYNACSDWRTFSRPHTGTTVEQLVQWFCGWSDATLHKVVDTVGAGTLDLSLQKSLQC